MGDTSFRPSAHGWPFSNNFTEYGICGGMAWSALDKYYTGQFIPDDLTAPSNRDTLFSEIWQRQFDSLPLHIIAIIYSWQIKPSEGHRFNPRNSIGYLVQKNEWPRIEAEIDLNRPVPLVLISESGHKPTNMIKNHQVLAYRYEKIAKKVKIWIYDSNHPNDNDVYLQITLGQKNSRLSAKRSTGEKLRGFFVNEYDNPDNIANSEMTMPDMWFNHFIFDKIVSENSLERMHHYKVSFRWNNGNVHVDYSIRRYRETHDDWIITKIPDAEGAYEHRRCQELSGSRDVPLHLNERWGNNHRIQLLLFDKVLMEQNVVLHKPFIFVLPYLHDMPHPYIEPSTDPGWRINDVEMSDVIVVQDSVNKQEISNMQNRILDLEGEPIYQGIRPNDPNACIIGFQSQYKIGYLVSKTFYRIFKGYLAENHVITYKKFKRQIGSSVSRLIERGIIPEQQHDNFEVFSGFNRDDYDKDQSIEITISATEFGRVLTESKTILYVKSLLRIQSPVFGLSAIDLTKFEGIQDRVHEYIDKELLKELVSEMPTAIQTQINNSIETIKHTFEDQANKVWETVQTEPAVVKDINSIYHNEFNALLHARMPEKLAIKTETNLKEHNDVINKVINDRGMMHTTEYLKANLKKRLIDDRVFNRVLSDAGIKLRKS